MSLLSTTSLLPCTQWKLKQQSSTGLLASSRLGGRRIEFAGGISRSSSIGFINSHTGSSSSSNRNRITAFFFNPSQDPIVKEALKEPVAFFGGIFAGILRLDLNEEPLKEWVTRTAEAAGISEEETNAEGSTTEAAPQEIEIE